MDVCKQWDRGWNMWVIAGGEARDIGVIAKVETTYISVIANVKITDIWEIANVKTTGYEWLLTLISLINEGWLTAQSTSHDLLGPDPFGSRNNGADISTENAYGT
jgi:hypothetical protein